MPAPRSAFTPTYTSQKTNTTQANIHSQFWILNFQFWILNSQHHNISIKSYFQTTCALTSGIRPNTRGQARARGGNGGLRCPRRRIRGGERLFCLVVWLVDIWSDKFGLLVGWCSRCRSVVGRTMECFSLAFFTEKNFENTNNIYIF